MTVVLKVGHRNNLQRHEKLSNLCENNKISDEFQYVLECNALALIKKIVKQENAMSNQTLHVSNF